MVFKGQINLDLGDAQDSTDNESKETNKISSLDVAESNEPKEVHTSILDEASNSLPDENIVESTAPKEPVKEVEAIVEEVNQNPLGDFAVNAPVSEQTTKPNPTISNEFSLGSQEEEPVAEPINIDLLPKFKIGESEPKVQKEEKQESTKNDFSMNLGGTNSTLSGTGSHKGPIIDAANLLPDDLETDVKVEKKERVKKEVAQPDVITNIAEGGIKVSEDIQLEELKTMLYKNSLGKQKRKKILMYVGISILAFSVLGGLGFLVFQNKDTILKNFAADILPDSEKTIVKEKVVTQIVDKDEYEAQNYTGEVAIVDREIFKNLEVEDFYKVYKTDFLFIDQATMTDKEKKNILTKLNLLVYAYNKGDVDYPLFRIKYNNLISNMLRMQKINEKKGNKQAPAPSNEPNSNQLPQDGQPIMPNEGQAPNPEMQAQPEMEPGNIEM